MRSSSGDTHSGGGVRAHGAHVEVDVVPGVVAAQVSCLVPEVISDHGLSLVRILNKTASYWPHHTSWCCRQSG